jgi:hypothetical protein
VASKRLAIVGLAGLIIGVTPYAVALAQNTPSLGEAASFAVLAGSAIQSTGATTITGDIGVSPGTTVSGSPIVRVGTIRNGPAQRAQTDAAAAYASLTALSCAAPPPSGIIPPGVYCVSQFGGVVTLDAGGNAGAVWIFRATTLTTAPGSLVRVINGGHERNVFWQVAGSATLGAQTTFVGNILAQGGITFGTGASLSGRALALAPTAAVTLDSNKVSLCCEAIALGPDTFPSGSAEKQYSATVAASGGMPSYTYVFIASIPGVQSSGATLSGIPTTPGSYPVTATATDALGCSVTRQYTIDIACSQIVVVPSATPRTVNVAYDLPRACVGVPYTQPFTTECASSPSCAVTSGAVPPGLVFANCTLSGTPTTPGIFPFTMTATDATHTAGHQAYRIEVRGINLPPTLPDGCVGAPYTATVNGGTVVFSGDIPPGLTPAGNTLQGIPKAEGCFNVVVTVTDSTGCTAARQYTICIRPPLALDTTPLPPVCLNTPYTAAIKASGCFPPYTFVFDPATPPGVVGTATGAITGTPTAPGCFEFNVTVTDSQGNATSAKYTICVLSRSCGVTDIPTLSQWGLVALSLALSTLGLVAVRRSS